MTFWGSFLGAIAGVLLLGIISYITTGKDD